VAKNNGCHLLLIFGYDNADLHFLVHFGSENIDESHFGKKCIGFIHIFQLK